MLKCFLENGPAFDAFHTQFEKSKVPTKKDLKTAFLAAVSAETNVNDFLTLVEQNLPFLVQCRYEDLHKKAIKLLFWSTAVFEGAHLKRSLELLARLINRDLYLQIQASKVRRLANDLSDFHPNEYRERTILLAYPCLDIHRQQLRQVTTFVQPERIMDLAQIQESAFYQLTCLTPKFEVESQMNLIIDHDTTNDIMKITGKDINGDGPTNAMASSNLMVRIHDDATITNSSLLEVSKVAHSNNHRLFWKFSLKKDTNKATIRPGPIQLNKNGQLIFTYKVSKAFKRMILKTVRKFKVNGLVIDTFVEQAVWGSLDFAIVTTMDRFRERLRGCTKTRSVNSIFSELDLINPFYLCLAKKLNLISPGFQFVSNDFENSVKIGWKYLFKPFNNCQIRTTPIYGLLNYLNGQFFLKLGGRPISDNFLFSQKSSSDPYKQAVIKKFYLFVRTKLSFYVVSEGSDIFFKKLSADAASIKQASLIATLQGKVYYFPIVIQEAMLNNAIIGCALVAEDRILVFFEKYWELERETVEIKVSLVAVYRFLKATIRTDQVDDWVIALKTDSTQIYLNFYEMLRNPVTFKFNQAKYVCELELVPRRRAKAEQIEVFKNAAPLKQAGYRFLAIKKFLNRFKHDANLGQPALLNKFVKLLNKFGVQSLADLNALFGLQQVSGSRKNYNIFTLMLKQLANEYQSFASQVKVSAEDVNKLLASLKLAPIGAITPEYGEFVKVGGLAVMIEDLCNGLAAEGESVVVIMPYYNKDKSGNEGYLGSKGVTYLRNMRVSSRYIDYDIGVHMLTRDRITFYFLHHSYLFPVIYQTVT